MEGALCVFCQEVSVLTRVPLIYLLFVVCVQLNLDSRSVRRMQLPSCPSVTRTLTVHCAQFISSLSMIFVLLVPARAASASKWYTFVLFPIIRTQLDVLTCAFACSLP